jgi:hypothetical protein
MNQGQSARIHSQLFVSAHSPPECAAMAVVTASRNLATAHISDGKKVSHPER